MKEEELTLEKAEEIVDNMYQNKWKITEPMPNCIDISKLGEVKYTELESASILLLRTELRQKREIEHLKNNWKELKKWLEEELQYDINWYKPKCKEYIGQKHFPDDTLDSFRYVLDKMQELQGENK